MSTWRSLARQEWQQHRAPIQFQLNSENDQSYIWRHIFVLDHLLNWKWNKAAKCCNSLISPLYLSLSVVLFCFPFVKNLRLIIAIFCVCAYKRLQSVIIHVCTICLICHWLWVGVWTEWTNSKNTSYISNSCYIISYKKQMKTHGSAAICNKRTSLISFLIGQKLPLCEH